MTVTPPVASALALLRLDASTYVRHALHGDDRAWPETNCYIDLLTELIHALGADPVAALSFTLAADFEGDQWTFGKHSLSDLDALYGIDIQELTIWQPVKTHVIEQVTRGRPVLVEVDSYFLPDTAGVAYRLAHTKTTIGIHAIDVVARTLGYFHNAGYYTLSGDDFDGVFTFEGLPPYTEYAKLDRFTIRDPQALRAIAMEQLRAHFRRRPRTNPFPRFRDRLVQDAAWLSGEPMDTFHQYAFATLRQCGASAELGATFLRWLDAGRPAGHVVAAAAELDAITSGAKALQFMLARATRTRKYDAFTPLLDGMETAWDRAMTHLLLHADG